jgi:hypothetical protein
MPTNVVIFTQPARLMINLAICSRHCQELDYEAIAVVRGDWGEAMDYLAGGEAEVIVVAEDDDLPPDRTPRIEVVAHMQERRAADLYRKGRNERSQDVNDSRRRRPRPIA